MQKFSLMCRNKSGNNEAVILPQDSDFLSCVSDLLENPKVLSMHGYIQHGETSCLQHCLSVSYLSYKFCRKHKLNFKSVARAALLHDLFLYDWHYHAKLTGEHFHGYTHPARALKNAEAMFCLNPMEKNIILRHMWPLTPIPPVFTEGFVVVWFDKYCGILEMMSRPCY